MKNGKTKKVSGIDLSMKSFLYVGDAQDTSTWLLPVYVPGDVQKTINLLKNNLSRFYEMKSIPESQKRDLMIALVGACKAHGIPVKEQVIALSDEENDFAHEEIREGNYIHGL